MKLNVSSMALAGGLVWGSFLFLITWWIIGFDGITGDVPFIGHVYRGYRISPAGSLIGFMWGFMDGMIGGALFAWLYNRFGESEASQA